MAISNKITTEEEYFVRGYWAKRSKAWDKDQYPRIPRKQYLAIAYSEAFIVNEYAKTLDIVDKYCNVFSVDKDTVLNYILLRAELAKKIGDHYAPNIEKLSPIINSYFVEKKNKEIESEKERKVLHIKRGEMLEQALVIIKGLTVERKKIADGMYRNILDKIYASPIDIIFKRGLVHTEIASRYNTIGELIVNNCEKLKSIGVSKYSVNYAKNKLKSCGLYFVSDLSVESWLRVAKNCGNCWRIKNNISCFDFNGFKWNYVYGWLNNVKRCNKDNDDNCNWSFEEESYSCGSFFKEITDNFFKSVGVREKMSMVQDLAEECYDIGKIIGTMTYQ